MSDTLEQPKTESGKGLAVIADLTPEIFTAEKAQEIVANLRAEIMLIDRDVSTKKGRDAIASFAHKIARSKTAADTFAKNLKDEYRKKADGIQAIRNIFWDGLEALQKDFRQPLTEFEAAEEARIKAHEEGIARIQGMALLSGEWTSEMVAARIAEVQAVDLTGFQEFAARAAQAKESALETLNAALENRRALEAERAELERLRQEAAERAAKEEADRIEREKQEAAAAAAERARREAEEKARREAEEAERRAAAERERVEREAREAEERAAQAERDRQAAEQRAKEAEEKAERDRIEAERRAEEERKAADERAKRQAEEAARLERERIEAQQRAEEEAERKREQDKAHRGRINRSAMEALIAAGLSETDARKAVEAIARGTVPNVKISY